MQARVSVDRQRGWHTELGVLASAFLKRSRWLHQLVMRWKSRSIPGLLVIPGQTRMVIEAFPRSSNSFLIRMLKNANPDFPIDNDTICHHTHSIHSVRSGVEHGVPTLVIIRDPVDCVTSTCIARQSSEPIIIWSTATEYLDFYSWLKGRLDRVVLVRFEDVIGPDLNRITRVLNERYQLGLREDIDTARIKALVEEKVAAHSPHKSEPLRYPLPTEERKELASRIRSTVEAHPRVIKARALYRTLLSEAGFEDSTTEGASPNA